MSNDRINYLLEQYLSDKASEDETAELKKIIEQNESSGIVKASLEQIIEKTTHPEWMGERLNEMVNEVLQVDKIVNGDVRQFTTVRNDKPVVKMWRRWSVAASIILALGIGSYFMFFNKTGKQNDIAKTNDTVPHDVKAPETNRAMITLANGQRVYLDSVGNGELAKQGNIKLVKLANGQIAYQSESGEIIKEIQYNTLFNPRGSKVIDMTLADGSRVWLNAGSSVTYPVAFVSNERKVNITGEAYFEVAHDATKPFYVRKNEMQLQVLGTHFNVNAYDDEADIKVTLLEGSVKISNGSESNFLKPGQQAQVSSDIKVVNAVDVDQVMAWKNGLFSFNRSDLQTVMKELGRWYDVDVVYEGGVPVMEFGGELQRNLNLSQVLKALEKSKVRFRIDGKKIVVMK